uniref:CST complex subunit STN1 n=1 Tax=Geotrypetes seraphini TaxID=260995 RepID=A0A6P8QK33_GEOSA|nr:CST complex subunit STN1 [Geotrypetes seraphini]XP_033797159.1 CST complex subunit STN1 [Geotrypetes seraphini]XP_033797160.1 CST complex subunit STN1 [Geotrypetes seraphini]
MQSVSAKPEKETPSLLWGLDPSFLAFAKMYIKDILEMEESRQVPSMFMYKGHPIKQVDILGTVVYKKERENFYNYGVDDSTAVVNCICWKEMDEMEKPPSRATSYQNTVGRLTLVEKLKKLKELECQSVRMEIGDVIRVRGYIRVFREQREVVASTYYKVDDPVCDIQISRMLELPYIYRTIYDRPFQVPEQLKLESQETNSLTFSSLVRQLSEKVKGFLMEDRVENFYQRELETMEPFMSMASQPFCSDQENSNYASASKQVHRVFKDVLGLLQEKGIIFQKSPNSDKVYHVTDYEKELPKVIINIIQADCKKQRHAEKGCHFLHILSGVRQIYSPCVTEAVMQRALDALERNSDIISTMEKFYVAF